MQRTQRGRAGTSAVLLWVAAGAACGGGTADAVGGGGASRCEPEPARPPGLLAAGSGTNLALVRALAARWDDVAGGDRVEVPESIGTSGAVRALLDGAIDLGLASRPLTDDERRRGLVETPLGDTLVALVLHPGPPVASIDGRELLEIYSGRRTAWPDGTPIVPLLREAGDSGERILTAAFPELGPAFDEARAKERWTICYTDQEMRDALLALPGALGLLDVGTLRLERLPLVALALGEVAATPGEALAGRYPLRKRLSALTVGAPAGAVAQFLSFARSPAASAVLEEGGYLPAELGD